MIGQTVSQEERQSSYLDPLDWHEYRRLGHKLVDDIIDDLQNISSGPAWQIPTDSARSALDQPLPRTGTAPESVYQSFRANILPYSLGNRHPRFWGWAMGTGTLIGAYAELLAAAMNSNAFGGDQGAVYVEQQVLQWLKEALDYSSNATGLLTSGASMANVIALSVALNSFTKGQYRHQGGRQAAHPAVLYCSSETHNSIEKAAELIGIGSNNVRYVRVRSDFRVDIDETEKLIKADLEKGLQPFCIVGNAGTVGTGAIDDMTGLRALADKYSLWFHVDGAIGAVGKLSAQIGARLDGMNSADSIAFDLHKWLSIPYECGCLLVRDPALHKSTFDTPASYLSALPGGISKQGAISFNSLGPELSRGMKALKVWFTLKTYGTDVFARTFEENISQAHYLESLIAKEPQLELMAPVALNVVCFRFRDSALSQAELNELNKQILVALQENGTAVPSHFVIDGSFCLRAIMINHRTHNADLDLLTKSVLELGNSLEPKEM